MLIYLFEDNPYEAAFFCSCLQDRGHEVRHFTRSVDLMDELLRQRPHLVVLDWVVAEVNGYVALRRIRERLGSSVPVAMLTCMDGNESIIEALEGGADDYLVKPMTRALLVARIEALLRRAQIGHERQAMTIDCPPYALDFRQQRLSVDGAAVTLTPKEFDLAWILFSNVNSFVPKAELLAGVWGRRAEIATHTVTQHVHVLRKKLMLKENGFRLSAVYGTGYRLERETAATAGLPSGFGDLLDAEPATGETGAWPVAPLGRLAAGQGAV